MPVILYIPTDPTDIVIQGDQLRVAAFDMGVHAAPAPAMASVVFTEDKPPVYRLLNVLVADDQMWAVMDNAALLSQISDPYQGTRIANNATVATPCGALYPHGLGNHLMSDFAQNSSRWIIAGVTRDNAGAALGNCRVVMLEVGRISKGQAPVVDEMISDGSGNYSIEVALNSAHQAIAYLSGSPDRAGISTAILTPAQA